MQRARIFRVLAAVAVVLSASLYSRYRESTSKSSAHDSSSIPVQSFSGTAIDLTDAEGIVERLAGALRFRTISSSTADNHAIHPKEFDGLHKHFRRSFPSVFKALSAQEVNKHSLLLEWKGSDPSLKPALCVSHLDVVAVGREEAWTHPPFSGYIGDGFVWGRGALDVKVTAVALLEAVSFLLKQGAVPKRTLYLAFGHDEEVEGERGAGQIAELLKAQGVELEFVSDEGGVLLVDGIKGITKTAVALVGTSEKALQLYGVEVHGKGGHSMVPPNDGSSVVSRLARIMLRLEKSLPWPRIESPTSDFFKVLATVAEKPTIAAVLKACDTWPLSIAAAYLISRTDGDLSACVRSTAVITELEASPAGKNVIPSIAKAYINFRLLPGESPKYAQELLEAAARGDRKGGEVRIIEERAMPQSPRSSTKSLGFQALRQAALETLKLPQGLAVAPYLMLGRTDSTHYTNKGLTKEVFRFMPFPMNRTAGDLQRIHGVDERVSIDGYLTGIKFYVRYLQHSLW